MNCVSMFFELKGMYVMCTTISSFCFVTIEKLIINIS